MCRLNSRLQSLNCSRENQSIEFVHHGIEGSVFLQSENDRARNDGTDNRGNQEWYNVCRQMLECRNNTHECNGNRIRQQPADDAGAEYFTSQCGQQLLAVFLNKPAEQGTAHAARECQQTAKA